MDDKFTRAIKHKQDQEWNKYFKILIKAADNGHKKSIKELNCAYLEKNHKKQTNNIELLDYYKFSYGSYALNHSGNIFMVIEEFLNALDLYKQSSSMGNIWATYNLGYLYDQYDIVVDSPQKAVNYYKLASKGNHVKSLIQLGNKNKYGYYIIDKGGDTNRLPPNISNALRYYQKAVKLGSYKAMVRMGEMYLNYKNRHNYEEDDYINSLFSTENKEKVKKHLISHFKRVKAVKKGNIIMKKEIKLLKRQNTHLIYRPDGPGHDLAKEEFVKIGLKMVS